MNVCIDCGFITYPDDKYCGGCGKTLPTSEYKNFSTQRELKIGDVRTNLASVYFKMGKYKEARSELESVLRENPDDFRAAALLEKINEVLEN